MIVPEVGVDPDRISASTRLIAESLVNVPSVGAAMAQVRDLHPLRPEVTNLDGEWRVVIHPGRDLYRKGTLRDYAVAVGDDENDQSPGFLTLSDDDNNAETGEEEIEES
ncbi:MAG: hypothetical protein L0I80_01745 [Brevibacterium sp.]|nr:hypothetical protein [Brevibacterium sp.]